MNPFWTRAEAAHRLKSMCTVLARELTDEVSRKEAELEKFVALKMNPVGLATYQKNSGLTEGVCIQILNEVREDLKRCKSLSDKFPEPNAIDGEKDLKTIYQTSSNVRIVWTASSGQKPVDLIVVRPHDESILLGDCKFGLKSESPWLVRNVEQFEKEFANKFSSVGTVLKLNDNIESRPEMLLLTTSALAPLLKNRIEDFKLDPDYAAIPYDRVRVCSIDDVYDVCRSLLSWD